MPTLILNPEHMQAVKDFADRTNQRAQLDEKIAYLETICNADHHEQWTLLIYSDFAPMSFYFQIYPTASLINGEQIPHDWQQHRIMNGGIIYHGKLEDNTRAETFAVELSPSNSWSIHT